MTNRFEDALEWVAKHGLQSPNIIMPSIDEAIHTVTVQNALSQAAKIEAGTHVLVPVEQLEAVRKKLRQERCYGLGNWRGTLLEVENEIGEITNV